MVLVIVVVEEVKPSSSNRDQDKNDKEQDGVDKGNCHSFVKIVCVIAVSK